MPSELHDLNFYKKVESYNWKLKLIMNIQSVINDIQKKSVVWITETMQHVTIQWPSCSTTLKGECSKLFKVLLKIPATTELNKTYIRSIPLNVDVLSKPNR